jgi:putative tryptophan/tyrosine transport system substrate-binding protein
MIIQTDPLPGSAIPMRSGPRYASINQRDGPRMRRRDFIAGTASAAAWPLAARAQPRERVPRIAMWMSPPDYHEGERRASAFRERLKALGWTDGRNMRADYREGVGDIDRNRAIAKELIDQQPDVILAESTAAVAALAREHGGIPIVFVNVSDPIGSGFVASLARPGGTITGFISNEPTLGGKWVQLLKEITPGLRRVGLLFNPDTASYAEAFLHQVEAAARILMIEPFAAKVHDSFDIERAMLALGNEPPGGLIMLPEATVLTQTQLIIRLAAYHRVPAIYAFEFQAAGGGLMSYGVDVADEFRGAAVYVDRILRGEKAANLPVQAPTKFKMVLNLTTAKALGIEVPTVTLLRADEVIE